MSKLSKFTKETSNKYLLVGAPNVGKSTIFNLLTNSTAIVSNIDRMTTEHTKGRIKKTQDYLIDLPGIYNLSHPIAEEKETHYHLIHGQVDGMLNVISAFSIQRDLYLTLQCIETGQLNTLAINMVDLINTKSIKWRLLSKKLNGVKIFLTRSNRNKNVKDLVHSLQHSRKIDPKIVTYSKDIEDKIEQLSQLLPTMSVSKRFASLMLLENNEYFIEQLSKHFPGAYKDIKTILDTFKNNNYLEEIRNTKEKFISKLLKECGYEPQTYLKINLSKQNRFDHFFLKKWIGIPLFILIVLAIYYLAFGNWAGGWIQTHLSDALTNQDWGLAHWMTVGFNNIHAPDWATSLVVDGIFGGVFVILAFIPTIIILYFLITIIQQVGLLSRVSILLDSALSKFGISGRSVVNLLTAFGCSVPALMLARSSSSKKERVISTLITPFVSCTTKVVVISAIVTAMTPVFGNLGWLCIFGFVVMSGFVALMMGLTFSKILFRKQKSFFCVEVVNWNGIDLRIILKNVGQQLLGFVKKTILIIVIANICFWALMHLSTSQYVFVSNQMIATDPKLAQTTILYYIGHGLSYVFYPIFGGLQWQLSGALVAGIPAKELILTNLNLVTANNIGSLFAGQFGPALALSFITFMMFYIPCVPAMNTLRSEVGWKNLGINLLSGFLVGYTLAAIMYWASYGICMVVR